MTYKPKNLAKPFVQIVDLNCHQTKPSFFASDKI